MKKIYLSISLFGIALAGISQPVIEAAKFLPVNGTTYTMDVYDGNTIAPGDAGADKTWDLSGATVLRSGIEVKQEEAITDPSQGVIPDYNFVLCTPAPNKKIVYKYLESLIDPSYDSYLRQYFKDSANSMYFCGHVYHNHVGLPAQVVYNKAAQVITFPANYNSQKFTADIEVKPYQIFDNDSAFTAITGDVRGSVTGHYDGYGTLKLPGGLDIPNVYRFKITESFAKDGGGQIETVNNVFYEYRIDKYPHPIIRFETHSYGLDVGPTVSIRRVIRMSDEFLFPALVAEMKRNSSVKVYPNPTVNEFLVEVENSNTIQIEVYNIVGSLVRSVPAKSINTKHAETINISDLPSGQYILKAKTDSETITRKISKI
jgi:hypothetical protein